MRKEYIAQRDWWLHEIRFHRARQRYGGNMRSDIRSARKELVRLRKAYEYSPVISWKNGTGAIAKSERKVKRRKKRSDAGVARGKRRVVT